MRNIDDILTEIEASELIGGLKSWGYPGNASPYSANDVLNFAKIDSIANTTLRQEFNNFKHKYALLSFEEKNLLYVWTMDNFPRLAWKREGMIFNRPEFANENFFKKYNARHGRLLDLAPAHGYHGVLLYREHHKLDTQLYACDLLPCYNKMLHLCNVTVEHYNAKHDLLSDVYAQKELFNVITCTEFLEHIDDVTEQLLLGSLRHVTSSTAKILITFPEIALKNGKIDETDPLGHVRQPSIEEVEQRLVNFKTLESGKFFSGKCHQMFIISERT